MSISRELSKFIEPGGSLSYDNTTSGLSATTIKSAIDELNTLLGGGNIGSQASFDVYDFTSTAAQTTFSLSSNHGKGSNIVAPDLSEGTEYIITDLGDTDFTLIGASSNTVGVTFTKTATAGLGTGTAKVVADYIPGYIKVYLNGVFLSETDYVASDGDNIVLDTGADVGALLSVVVLDSFNIATQLRVLGVDAGAPDNSLVVNSSGNVGVAGSVTADGLIVGTTSDAYSAVYIISSVTGESELRMGDTDTDAGSIAYTNSDNTMTFRAAAAARMTLDSTGIDVTGSVTADGLTVESGTGNIGIVTKSTDQFAFIGFEDNTSSASSVYVGADGNDFIARANSLTRFRAASNGDISFYNAAETSQSLFWDASTERLGIGTTAPTQPLNVVVPDNSGVQIESAAGHKAYLFFGDDVSNTAGRMGYDHATNVMGLWTAGAERVVIDSSGIDVTGIVQATGGNFTGQVQFNGTAGVQLDNGAQAHTWVLDDNFTSRFNIGTSSASATWKFGSNNNAYLAVSPSGIDVTGTVTADGLTVDASSAVIQSATGSSSPTPTTFNISTTSSASDWSSTSPWGRLAFYSGDGSGGGGKPHVVLDATVSNAIGASSSFSVSTTSESTNTLTKRLNIAYNGDLSFYDAAGSNQSFFWDASTERLGIGTDSPSATLTVSSATDASIDIKATSSTTQDAFIKFDAPDSGGAYLGLDDSEQLFKINNASALSSVNHLVIDSSGNVGIGTAPLYPLDILGSHTVYAGNVATSSTLTTSYNVIRFTQGAGSGAPTGMIGTGGSATVNSGFAGAFAVGTQDSAPLTFLTGDTERMRIDASGNLLVGTTSTVFTNSVIQAKSATGPTIGAQSTAAAEYAGGFWNYATGDANLLAFYSGSTGALVGSIGTSGGGIYLGSPSGAGKYFANNSNFSPSTNGSKNLGDSSLRWQDLHLSGGVVYGDAGGSGTPSSNTLDSYEEGTFTPITLGDTTAGTGTYGFQHGSYTKVGNLVTVNIYVDTTSHTGTGSLRVGGLPFTVKGGSDQYAAVSFGELINVTKTAGTIISGYTVPTTTTISINQIEIGTTETNTTGVNMDGLVRILLTVTYQT